MEFVPAEYNVMLGFDGETNEVSYIVFVDDNYEPIAYLQDGMYFEPDDFVGDDYDWLDLSDLSENAKIEVLNRFNTQVEQTTSELLENL